MNKTKLASQFVKDYLAGKPDTEKINKTDISRQLVTIYPNSYKDVEFARTFVRKAFKLIECPTVVAVSSPIKRLFFDIETTPMLVATFRIGNKVSLGYKNIVQHWKIITIGYKWEHEDEVHTLSWGKNHDDKQLLLDFIKIANTADELIAHNGDRFDIKKIRTRCIANRIPMFPSYRTLDTLKKSRGSFYFDSNSLDSISDYLGLANRKLSNEGIGLWLKTMEGDAVALNEMETYCKHDVIVLEDLYHVLQHYITPSTHAGVHNGLSKYTCPICASDEIILKKTDVTPKGTVVRIMECQSCGHIYTISNKAYRDWLMSEINKISTDNIT